MAKMGGISLKTPNVFSAIKIVGTAARVEAASVATGKTASFAITSPANPVSYAPIMREGFVTDTTVDFGS
jgi:hypothetical protein